MYEEEPCMIVSRGQTAYWDVVTLFNVTATTVLIKANIWPGRK